MFIPRALYYTKNHLWLRQIGLYDYFIGITDFAQKEVGEISLVEHEPVGSEMKKEMIWSTIYGLNQTVALITPFKFKIMAANTTICQRPSSINSDPYTHWFLRVAVENSGAGSTLLSSEEYTEHIQ